MTYTVRPLSDRSWLRPARRGRSRFTAYWSDTLDLLQREVAHLGGRDLVIEIDVPEHGIKNDGMLRSNARPTDPAVVVAFESKHGPLLYRSDQFSQLAWGSHATHPWQDNVRAVALTLEALRAVDRYGATETGQQYAGFKALPAGRAMPPSHMTTEQAYDVLCEVLGPKAVVDDDVSDEQLVRRAKAAAHPDRNGGDRTFWDQVEQAATVLGVTR